MPTRSAALAAAVVAVSLGAPAATAAPRPVCNLVSDARGDVLAPDDTLDILSADIATDGSRLTGVVRLAGRADATSLASATGRIYRMQFAGAKPSAPVVLTFVTSPTGQAATYGWHHVEAKYDTDLGHAAFKVKGNELYLTVPLAVFAPYGTFKKGSTIGGLRVATSRLAGVYASKDAFVQNPVAADSGTAAKGYVSGSRSCVRVGG